MYKKSVIKKIGSIVVVAAMLASAFAMLPGNVSGTTATDVYINEFLPNPTEIPDGDYEFIEIYNGGDSSVDLTGWTLEDEFGSTTTYTITGTINPGEFKLFWKNETGITLNNDEEGVWLKNSTGAVVDHFNTTTITEGKSWARIPDGTGEWQEAVPTPGITNGGEDTTVPEISNVDANPDPQYVGGWVNITCNVTDNIGVDTVKVDITGPTGFTPVNATMSEGSYYYNATYDIVGTYHYFIWANDTSGNTNVSDEGTFEIITNFEVKPKSGSYMGTVTMEIYNATAGDTIELWKPGATTWTKHDWANSNGRVTFDDVLLDTVGDWTIKDVEATIEIIFKVNPAPLTVTVSPSEKILNQSISTVPFEVTIKDKDGNYVENADIAAYWIDKEGENQNADTIIVSQSGGNYSIKVRGLEGIGTYNITASKNTTGDATPELGGYVHTKILPNDLTFTDMSTEDAREGFPSEKLFLVKYADANHSI